MWTRFLAGVCIISKYLRSKPVDKSMKPKKKTLFTTFLSRISDHSEQNMSEFRLLNEGGGDSSLPLFVDKLQLKARNIHTHLVVSATSASLRLLTFLRPKRQALIIFDEKQTIISTAVNSADLHSGHN